MILEEKNSYFGNIWYQSGQSPPESGGVWRTPPDSGWTTWASENYCMESTTAKRVGSQYGRSKRADHLQPHASKID